MDELEPPEFAAFMSYAHIDHSDGYLTSFRKALSREIHLQTGQEFPIFQDRKDILWGKNWSSRIDQALNAATFLIVIITPSFFRSQHCQNELEKFVEREETLGRSDLILPIYFIDSTTMKSHRPQAGRFDAGGIIASRQYIDCRDLRFEPLDSVRSKRELARIASQLRDASLQTADTVTLSPSTLPSNRQIQDAEKIHLRTIQSGSLWMGTDFPSSRERERPAHNVSISNSFLLSRTPVTVKQFEEFVKSTGYRTTAEKRAEPVRTWHDPGFVQGESHPVVCVSWFDALEFCIWLSNKTGNTYRLPTEAEWEYSCRAASSTRWFSGKSDTDLRQYAWLKEKEEVGTHPVATKSPNTWGLYDMHGNIWEWCQDFFGVYDHEVEAHDPKGPPNGVYRVARGGSWRDSAEHATASYRCRIKPFQHANNIGFRVAADP